MSAKAIREASGKDLINRHLSKDTAVAKCRFVAVDQQTDLVDLVDSHPWLKTDKLVVKPDQLIKRRGKLGLIAVNKDFVDVKKWIAERMNKDQKVGEAVGKLRSFIIEPFVPHKDNEEIDVDFIFNVLEINPLVVTDKEIYVLDLAAKLDSTPILFGNRCIERANGLCPFGRDAYRRSLT
ncbi:hypothetical protein FQR65_LT18842 [Abscondita terminalis]|nr:hypothetical protein FQR65_LT18842 [Abscondita terminalis]